MGIDSKHPLYSAKLDQWCRCRYTFDGEDAVKEEKGLYLPKLSGQESYTDSGYLSYLKRASFYNGVARTVSGLVGAVMRNNPVIEGVSEEWATDITGTDVSLNSFISYMLTEQLLTGRQGVMVDHDGVRPYLTGYTTENITNWINLDKELKNVIVLKESYRRFNPNDGYDSSYDDRYRELIFDEEGYTVRVWEEKDQEFKVVQEYKPTFRGEGLDEIPFVPISLGALNFDPQIPPLMGLVDMNLSHYRTSADLEHGRHFTALPTPYVTGCVSDDKELLKIGAETAWILPDAGCKAGFLEFTGQGLGALETALEQKRSMMASLGAQLLEGQKNGVEASETLRIRQNSEASTLMMVVQSVEAGIQKALQYMVDWNGGGEVSVKLNTDFSSVQVQPHQMTALMSAWQSGAISHETFLWNMKKGEILDPEISIEDERDRISVQMPEVEEVEIS
jgi:hypothetical protein